MPNPDQLVPYCITLNVEVKFSDLDAIFDAAIELAEKWTNNHDVTGGPASSDACWPHALGGAS